MVGMLMALDILFIIIHASATYIAPGQAFFVAAASSTAANLSFTEAMQTTTGGDDFINLDPGNTSSEFF